MRHLLPLIFCCVLLCGCGKEPSLNDGRPAFPTPSVAAEVTQAGLYPGAAEIFPLTLEKVHGLKNFSQDLLIFSGHGGTQLTLVDPETLEDRAGTRLSFQLEAGDASLVIREDRLSFFDPEAGETVVLDSRLEEIQRIEAPPGLTGQPLLWDNTLYYCTASEVRAWDLQTGIRRRVKEMAFDSQSITSVMLEGTVLQCTVTEGADVTTLFLSSQDGRLLHTLKGTAKVQSLEDAYYVHTRVPVFGRKTGDSFLLLPRDWEAPCILLPEAHGALTLSGGERGELNYYDLASGQRRCALTLEPGQYLRSAAALSRTRLALLVHDPDPGQERLILWDIREGGPLAVQDGAVYTAPSFGGSADCRDRAESLGRWYGIRVLLGQEAIGEAPLGCQVQPESLAPLTLETLAQLEEALQRYPREILDQTIGQFSRLNLCLVRSIDGGGSEAAGTQFLKGSEAYILIPTGPGAGQALNHELFHLMEIRVFSESRAFDQWNALNPAGFQYDYDYEANALRDSGVYLFQENRSFVDTYSMSYPKEDRARIFEYAMLPGQEALFLPRNMQNKLQQLCAGIREAYELEDLSEALPWEQYLE